VLRGFYNLCRHRGSRLVAGPDEASCGRGGRFGNSIRCPYHSWTYGLAGELRHAPFLTEEDGLARDRLGLHPVDVATWGGFAFVHLTPAEDRPPLLDALGGAPERVSRYPLSELRRAHRIRYDVAANWKVILENYNECYHCGPVHPELCEVVPAFRKGGAGLDWEQGIPHREGAWTFTRSGTTDRAAFPGLSEEERTRHKGELVYPNLMLSLSADHVAAFTLWPRSPSRTAIACDFLFHPGEMARPGFDPADAVEFWDLVNRQDWEICERVQAGMGSRVWRHGYYAPMEDASLDIRRYVGDRLGEAG
jgi:glycine betaine catabolism A